MQAEPLCGEFPNTTRTDTMCYDEADDHWCKAILSIALVLDDGG